MEKVNVSNKIKKKKNFYTHQLPTVLPPHNYKNKKGKKKKKTKPLQMFTRWGKF